METQNMTIETIVTAIQTAIATLQKKQTTDGNGNPLVFPNRETVRETVDRLIRSVFTETDGRPRLLKRPRKNAETDETAFFKILQWHRSGGNLHGLMAAQLMVDRETFDQIETIATVCNLVLFGRSTAVDRWNSALFGR
jgi:hypothetical protein